MGKNGLQLYSVKDFTAQDFLGTIRQVADFGYEGVQFAGFFDTAAKELKAVLDEKGIEAAGSHTGYHLLQGDELKKTLEYNHTINNDLIICPSLPEEAKNSIDAYKRTAEFFNEVGRTCKENGFTFGYHNHAFEFEAMDGERGFDVLFSNTESDLVQMELDCYWAAHGGDDPLKLIQQYKERVVSLHIKDMKRIDGEKTTTEVGNGELDMKSLLDTGKQYGVRWFVVEQENFDQYNPLEAAEINIQNLKKIG